MKRIFTFLFGFMCVLALNAQNLDPFSWNGMVLADIDDPSSYSAITTYGGGPLSISYQPAPSGAPESVTTMAVADCQTTDQGSGGGTFTIVMVSPMADPHDYVGMSFLCQSDYTDNQIPFIVKMESTQDGNNNFQAQDWDTWAGYDGGGNWQQVRLPFAVCLAAMDGFVSAGKIDPLNYYDKIELAPAAYKNFGEIIINMAQFYLRYDWDEPTGIPLAKLAAFTILNDGNGNIKATGINGGPVSLKVYSPAGQEIMQGVNNVQIGIKGIYIVKATDGKTIDTQKIVVH